QHRPQGERQTALNEIQTGLEGLARNLLAAYSEEHPELLATDNPSDFAQMFVKLARSKPAEEQATLTDSGLRRIDLDMLVEQYGNGARYYPKAMNCPHHHKLLAAVPRGYR